MAELVRCVKKLANWEWVSYIYGLDWLCATYMAILSNICCIHKMSMDLAIDLPTSTEIY